MKAIFRHFCFKNKKKTTLIIDKKWRQQLWRHVKVYVLRCLSSPGFDSDISLLLLPPARKSIEYFPKILNFSINGVIHFLFPRYFCSLEVFLKEFSPKLKETHVQTEPLTGLKGFFFFLIKKKSTHLLLCFCSFFRQKDSRGNWALHMVPNPPVNNLNVHFSAHINCRTEFFILYD